MSFVPVFSQSNKTNNDFKSLYMDGSNAIAGSYSGTGLLYSSNSGKTWTQSNITSGNFNSVYMDGSNAIAGSNGTGLLYSSNSGETWSQSNKADDIFYSVYMDGSNAIAGSFSNTGLWYSTDSGVTWSQSNKTTENFYSVYMDGSNAIAGSNSDTGLWYSSNSGETWSQSNKTSGLFISVYMDGSNAIAGSYSGTGLLYSSNSGVTWTQSNKTIDSFNSIYMDGSNAIAGSNGTGLLYSSNSGETWSQSNKADDIFYSVYMDGSNAIAASYSGTGLWYSSNSGVTWAQSNKTTDNFNSVYMDGSNNVIAGSSSDTGLWYSLSPINPTINFPNMNNYLPDASFVLNPSSNSSGAFTYTSADTSIASISGNIVTLQQPGITVITATQAATDDYTSGSATAYLNIMNNICFPAGTPITCDQGNIPIEKIDKNVHTIRGKKIVAITQTITPDKFLVCFEKDSLGENIPSQKTLISRKHKVFYKGKMMEAQEFIDKFDTVYRVKYTGEVLYNVLMEKYEKMMVNNLICETLHPENVVARLYNGNYSPSEFNEIVFKMNECVKKQDRKQFLNICKRLK